MVEPPRSLPHRFGAYELLDRVGQGGMAEVWLARRAVMPGVLKPCALKIIHGRVATEPRYRRMFLQEARLALKLRHTNVISVFDAGQAHERLFMALEWIDGVDLRRFTEPMHAAGQRLSIPTVCHVIAEVLQGLRHAHGLSVGGRPLGVIHRDIAPHNVLVSTAGEVKLGDFGIARVAGELSSGEHIKGRARYMAPERLDGEITQASDLFAIGGILHELLDGRRFREDLRRRHDWHRVVAEAPIPGLSRTDVPAPLEALRVGLLQADPRRRIATAEHALERLLQCSPWPPGTGALQSVYERWVGAPRRTGLTRPDARRPPSPARPVVRTPTATLEPRAASGSPSWTPSPSSSPATVPARAHDLHPAPVVRRRSIPRRRPRPTRRVRAVRWIGRGLWALAGLLALVATGLALGSPATSLPACIDEPSGSAAEPARLRIRGDDRPSAQVRIDMQVLEVGSGIDCRLSPGTHALDWRSAPERPWRVVGSHTLVSAKEHLVRVGEDGLAISAYDP